MGADGGTGLGQGYGLSRAKNVTLGGIAFGAASAQAAMDLLMWGWHSYGSGRWTGGKFQFGRRSLVLQWVQAVTVLLTRAV